jgi:signal transduction histidine kinase
MKTIDEIDNRSFKKLLKLKSNNLQNKIEQYILNLNHRVVYIPFLSLVCILVLVNTIINTERYNEAHDYILSTVIILLLTLSFTLYLAIDKLYKCKYSSQGVAILIHLLVYLHIINSMVKESSNQYPNEQIRGEYVLYFLLAYFITFLLAIQNLITNMCLSIVNLGIIIAININNDNNSYVLFLIWVLCTIYLITHNMKLQVILKNLYIDFTLNNTEKELYHNLLINTHCSCIINSNMGLVYTNRLFDIHLKGLVVDKVLLDIDSSKNLHRSTSIKETKTINLNTSEIAFFNSRIKERYLDCKTMTAIPHEKLSSLTFGHVEKGSLQDSITKHIQSDLSDERSFVDFKSFRYTCEESLMFYRVYLRRYQSKEELYEIFFIELPMSDKLQTSTVEKSLKNLLLAKISHEFKSPLSYIQQNIDNLIESTKGKAKSKLLRVRYIAEALLLLVYDICDYTKDSDGDIENNSTSVIEIPSLKEYLFQITKVLLLIHNKKLPYDIIVDEQLEFCKITADEKKLKQIVHNIISNAIKNTASGHINIILKQDNNERTDDDVRIARYSLNMGMVLIIEDSGKGLDDKYITFINEDDHSIDEINILNTKRVPEYSHQKGLGIGLNLCKKLCRELHIGIKAELIAGPMIKGTRFTLRFNIRLTTNSCFSINTKVVNNQYFTINQYEKKNIYYSSDDSIIFKEGEPNCMKSEVPNNDRRGSKDKSIIKNNTLNRQNSVHFNIPGDHRRCSVERVHPLMKLPSLISNTQDNLFMPDDNDYSIVDQYRDTIIYKNQVADGSVLKVFVVDDNVTNQEAIVNSLKQYHKSKNKKSVMKIKKLNDGVELLYELYHNIIKGKEIPNLIICDEMMEYLNGSETYAILVKNFFEKVNLNIPFVICSAFEDEGHFEKMKKANITHSFKKPLSRGNVEYILENLINY